MSLDQIKHIVVHDKTLSNILSGTCHRMLLIEVIFADALRIKAI